MSPNTGASHLVTYRFFNLAYRGGDTAEPQTVEPGVPFSIRVPLNLMGHTFKQGWRIRLALSPSFYPTLWESPEAVTLTVETGETERLPGQRADPARARAAQTKTSARSGCCRPSRPAPIVNPDDYLPTLAEARPAVTTRKAYPVTINGRPGMLTRKVFDSGRYQYGGPLQNLWVDLIAEENFQMVIGDPLSLVGFTRSTTILERPETGFRARSETSTNVWSETDGAGGYVFRYRATVKTFIGGPTGTDRPFAEKTVDRRDRALLDLTGFAGWVSLEALAS